MKLFRPAWVLAILSAGLTSGVLAAPNPAAVPSRVPAGAETLFGLRPGMDLDDAREALRHVGSSHADPQPKIGPQTSTGPQSKPAVPGTQRGEEEEEGHTELWTLRGTPYKQVVLKADAAGQVQWITAIARPDQPSAFARFGAASKALVFRDTLAVWNVLTPRQLPYRLIVRGDHEKAHVISLVLLTQIKQP